MATAAAADDLDLLLSLDADGGEAVLETPPSSPRRDAATAAAFTPPRAVRPGGTDMSVFRDAVKDYLDATPAAVATSLPKGKRPPKSTETIVDAHSGLRIRSLTASPLEITNRFADIRFVRISAIR
jgi:minichromosome maintenance protein 10